MSLSKKELEIELEKMKLSRQYDQKQGITLGLIFGAMIGAGIALIIMGFVR